MKGGAVMKNFTFSNLLIIFLGVIAIMGFCFTSAFAEMDDPMSSSNESEDHFMLEEPGEDLENYDGAFGRGMQYTWIPIDNFTMWRSTDTYNAGADYYRYFINPGYHYMGSGINLPSGAYLYGARAYYYDSTTAGRVQALIWRFTAPSNRTLLRLAESSGTPGYGSLWLLLNHTIRNGDGYYVIYLGTSTNSPNLRVGGVRLFWNRQVRTGLPNPFDDIGGLNNRFQNAIIALAASGITTGCDANSFCPNSPVTRGQMAVFLAEALGLHWGPPY
jgi:hypothetical protein